jgi:hypothetical protein
MTQFQSDPLARSVATAATDIPLLFELPAVTHKPNKLIYGGRVPRQSTDTSATAADRLTPKAPNIRMQILAFVREHPEGVIGEEAGAHLAQLRGLPPGDSGARLTAAARMTQVRVAGYVRDSGRRRATASGCPAIVFEPTEKAGDGRVAERQ